MSRGVAREGRTAPGARLEGVPMKPTSSKKLLFYRIIIVCFSKKVLLFHVLAPPLDKKQIRSSKNMEMLGPYGPPTTKNRPTKNLIHF